MTHHRGANALAAEQTITFGQHLTIVYGQNAAGKSGYSRILKQVCRSRFTEPILGNLLSGTAPVTLQATITFRQGAQDTRTEWTVDSSPSDALAAVSVFDAGCAPVYLRDKTDVAFRPFGLDTFDRLAALCGEVRTRLENEKAKLNALAPVLPTFPAGTRTKSLVDHISSLTRPDDVRALATLSPKDQARLDELREHQRDLLAADPKQRARELTSRAERVDLLGRHVAYLFVIFRGSALDHLRSTAESLRVAQQALALLRKTALTPDLLPGTGEEAWRKMWEATEAFSTIAYARSPFPALESGARCPFCQQEISNEAKARLQHFTEYVSSTAQAQVREAERAHKTALSTVSQAVIARPDLDLAINELRTDNSPLAQEVEDFLQATEGIQKGIVGAVAQRVGFLGNGVTHSAEVALQTAASGLRERAKQLLIAEPAMTPGDAAELKELEARVTFSQHLQAVWTRLSARSVLLPTISASVMPRHRRSRERARSSRRAW